MRGRGLAPPKRPHTEPDTPARLTKRINVDAQPPQVPPHYVVKQGGDESWLIQTTPDGETGVEEEDDIIVESIVYLGKGHASTK